LKALYWDRTGFALWMKRLERNQFPWPMNHSEVQRIDREKLQLLLSGINFWDVHEEVKFSSIY